MESVTEEVKNIAEPSQEVFKKPILIRTQQESKQANYLNEFSYCDA